MELSNLGRMPVALYPGMRICAFSFEEVSSPVSVPYRMKRGNKYAGQVTPRASLLADENRTLGPDAARIEVAVRSACRRQSAALRVERERLRCGSFRSGSGRAQVFHVKPGDAPLVIDLQS